MSEDRDRLKLIVKALTFCEQAVTQDALIKQFKIETGRNPTRADLALYCKRTPGETVSSLPD